MKSTAFLLLSGLLLSLVSLAPQVDAATMTLTPTDDTYIWGSTDDDVIVRGTGGTIQVGALGNGTDPDMRSLIRFDPTPLAGKYDAIDSITLRLFFNHQNDQQGATVDYTVSVHRILDDNAGWVQGISDTNTGATWNELEKNGPDWEGSPGLRTAGTDYNPSSLAIVDVSPNPMAGQTMHPIVNGSPLEFNEPVDFEFNSANHDLTALIDDWLVTNPGLLLFTPTQGLSADGLNRLLFHSSDRADLFPGFDPSPQLIVTYSTTATVPEPSTFALLGLGLGLCLVAARRRQRRK